MTDQFDEAARERSEHQPPQRAEHEFMPEGEDGGDGAGAPLIPDDASELLDVDSPVEAPVEPSAAERTPAASDASDWEIVAKERTADLQRLQAEYVNYKRRVDRDRDVAKQKGIQAVVTDLMPVLDAIEAAKQHEELDGGFKLVTEALEKVAAKYGLVLFGEVGEEFDPHLHEALMHMPLPEGIAASETTVVSAVLQKGVKLGDRVIRPARVGVADPA